MSIESRLQTKVIKWLKEHDCIVIKLSATPGVPSGIPDVLFFADDGRWGFLEVKASPTAKFQPLQKKWIEKLDELGYASVVYPENWVDIQIELLGVI